MLKLFLFVLPLGLDTFAVAAALGMHGLPSRQRLRVSLVMSSFEMAMPVVGLLLGPAERRVLKPEPPTDKTLAPRPHTHDVAYPTHRCRAASARSL